MRRLSLLVSLTILGALSINPDSVRSGESTTGTGTGTGTVNLGFPDEGQPPTNPALLARSGDPRALLDGTETPAPRPREMRDRGAGRSD